jgi:Flp pilus assembly pilin Flp
MSEQLDRGDSLGGDRPEHIRERHWTHERGPRMNTVVFIRKLWSQEAGQDIAEYAVMLAVILVLVVGTIRLVGSNANNAFSAAASSIQ